MSQEEIKNDFRHIKQYGTLPEKRRCHRGIHCRHRHQCPFVHPDEGDIVKSKKQKNFKFFEFEQPTDEEMQNALFMGQINAARMNENYQNKLQKKKKMISVFGQCEEDEIISSDLSDNEPPNMEILHPAHSHKLKLIERSDCDFIICDVCSKEYKGASFHCLNGCDFDLRPDCVLIDDELMQIPKD